MRKTLAALAVAACWWAAPAEAQTYTVDYANGVGCGDRTSTWTRTHVTWSEGGENHWALICIRATQTDPFAAIAPDTGTPNYTVQAGRVGSPSGPAKWGWDVYFNVGGEIWPADWELQFTIESRPAATLPDACADSIGQPPCTSVTYTFNNTTANQIASPPPFYRNDYASACPSWMNGNYECYWQVPYSSSNSEVIAELVTLRAINAPKSFNQSATMCVKTSGASC